MSGRRAITCPAASRSCVARLVVVRRGVRLQPDAAARPSVFSHPTFNGKLRDLHPLPRLAPSVIENRLAEWRRLLRQSTTQGRAVLQRILRGRITFTPRGQGYRFVAPTRFDKLFSGIVVPRPAFIPTGNRGAEHIGPEDTFDGDYGRLLARVCANHVKWFTSSAGFSPFSVVGRVAA